MTEIISSQLYFILLKDENRTKKSLQSTQAPAVRPFLRTLPFSHSSSQHILRQTALKSRCASPQACVSPISSCLIPVHFQETLCSSTSRLKIISSSSYFVNFSSLEGSQLGEELCNLTVSWGNSPVKCIPIAYPSPWYISLLLRRESFHERAPSRRGEHGGLF